MRTRLLRMFLTAAALTLPAIGVFLLKNASAGDGNRPSLLAQSERPSADLCRHGGPEDETRFIGCGGYLE